MVNYLATFIEWEFLKEVLTELDHMTNLCRVFLQIYLPISITVAATERKCVFLFWLSLVPFRLSIQGHKSNKV